MIQMTHLIWRGGRAYFRCRLPTQLRAINKPSHWPDSLSELVSEKNPHKLKHELSRALETRDERAGKKAAAALVPWAEDLFAEGERFLREGPKANLSESEIKTLASRFGSKLVRQDLELRQKGIGLKIPNEGEKIWAALNNEPTPRPRVKPDDSGLTPDDLSLLKHIVDAKLPEIERANALQRPPPFIKEFVADALDSEGILLDLKSPERRRLELAFLEQYTMVLDAYGRRNLGKIVATPMEVEDDAPIPTIQQAFVFWRDGQGTRGEKLPSSRSVQDAEYTVRRFKELHGNILITEITTTKAKAFRDALAKIPPRLPHELQSMPIEQLLRRLDLPKTPPSAATVRKRLTLIIAVMNKAAIDAGLKAGLRPWHNPFEGLKPATAKGTKGKRSSFTLSDIKTLMEQDFIRDGDATNRGGKGPAARWLPLLAMFTGARRKELAQLKLTDVRNEGGIDFLAIVDSDEYQSVKTETSIRRVPIHPELIKCGFLEFVAERRDHARRDDWLFDNLLMNATGDRGDAWGKWFSRQLRDLGLDAGGRKVFHSFRHTFISRCRESDIDEEVRTAITGHAESSVGRNYGGDEGGFRFSLARLKREISKVCYPELDFQTLRVSA